MPNETIVAVYETSARAEETVQDLLNARVPSTAISRHTADGSYAGGATEPTSRARAGLDLWSGMFGGSAGDDRAVYDRALEGGGAVVSVTSIPEHNYEPVRAILERHDPIDIDERMK